MPRKPTDIADLPETAGLSKQGRKSGKKNRAPEGGKKKRKSAGPEDFIGPLPQTLAQTEPAAPEPEPVAPPPDIAVEPITPPEPPAPTPPPERRVSLPKVEAYSTRLRTVLLNLAFVGAFLLFVPVLAAQFMRNEVLIDTITVPEPLLNLGVTSDVVASRLWDGIRDATEMANTSKSSVSAIPNSRRVQFSLPEAGLSMESVVQQTRQFFQIYQTRIGGEFVCSDPACLPEGMRLRLRVIRNTSTVIDLPPIGTTPMRDYFTQAAVQVLTVLDPFVAIAAISDKEPVRATTLARHLIRQHHPDTKWAHNLIGNIKSEAGDLAAALPEYQAAITIDPGFQIARINYATTLRQLGDPVGARVIFDDIARTDPNNPRLLRGYAELEASAGKPELAVEFLVKAGALDPQEPYYYARAAEIETEAGNIEAANAFHDEALAIDPSYPLSVQAKFVQYLQSGELDRAGDLLRDATDYNPDDFGLQGLYGVALLLLDRSDEAMIHFEKALAIDPDDPDILEQYARLLGDAGRHDEAVATLLHVLEVDPYRASAVFDLASVYMTTGKKDEALVLFRRVLELDTTGTQYPDLANTFIELLTTTEPLVAEPAVTP